MTGRGVLELLALLLAVVVGLVPVAVGVWALLTLRRLLAGQDDLRRRLDAIEQLLRSRP